MDAKPAEEKKPAAETGGADKSKPAAQKEPAEKKEAVAEKKPATPAKTPEEPAAPSRPGEAKPPLSPVHKPVEAKKGPSPRQKEWARNELAKLAAFNKVREVYDRLEDMMNQYEKKKVHYENATTHRAGEKPPAELDFAALAKQYGLSRGQTDLVSAKEVVRYDIGRSLVEGQ